MMADGGLRAITALIERSLHGGGERRFRRRALFRRSPETMSRAVQLGFLSPDGRTETVNCSRCASRHPVSVEADAETGRPVYTCLASGRVELELDDIELLAPQPQALAAEVARALDLPHRGWKDRIAGAFIELGTVKRAARAAPWTACVAFGLDRPGVLREAIAILADRVSTAAGYVFTTSSVPTSIPLPRGHQLVALADAFQFSETGLDLAVAPPRATVGRRRTGKPPGPSPSEPTSLRIARDLRRKGREFESFAEAARAVRALWPEDASVKCPVQDTVEGHLSDAERAGEWSRRGPL